MRLSKFLILVLFFPFLIFAEDEIVLNVSEDDAVVVVEDGVVSQIHTLSDEELIAELTFDEVVDVSEQEGDGVYVVGSEKDSEEDEEAPKKGFITKVIDYYSDKPKDDEDKRGVRVRILPSFESYELPLRAQIMEGRERSAPSIGLKLSIKFGGRKKK